MPVTITDVGSATGPGTSGGTTTPATVTASVANNDWLVVFVSLSYPRAITLTDSAGNTYTSRARVDTAPSATNNAHIEIFTAPVTANITNGTVNSTLDGGGRQVVQVFRVRPSSGTISFVGADTTGQFGNTTLHAANAVSVANGDTIFGCACVETKTLITGDTDTTNGSWSAASTVTDGTSSDDTANHTGFVQWKSVTATGNQNWSCSTSAAKYSARSYLVLHSAGAAFSLVAAQGSYALSGTAATLRLGLAPIVAGAGSYALTGTAASPELGRAVAAAQGSYAYTGTDAATTHQWKTDATVAGSYALTGTDAIPFRTPVAGKTLPADFGTYTYGGTDAVPLHGYAIAAAVGSYALAGTDTPVTHQWRTDATVASSYVLTGSSVALNAATGNKTIIPDPGTYALAGTNAGTLVGFRTVVVDSGFYALTGSEVILNPSQKPPVMGVVPHYGESVVESKRQRQRQEARTKERAARKRFRDAIGRLLEGLPPEFDEPELAQVEVQAVEAFNLLKALRAPTPELDQVSAFIDHIRQLRQVTPMARLAVAQAFNRSHQYVRYKAQEDAAMSLLLGE